MRKILRRITSGILTLTMVASLMSVAPYIKAEAEESGINIINANFESDPWGDNKGWIASFESWNDGRSTIQLKTYADNNIEAPQNGSTAGFNFYSPTDNNTATFTQNISIPAGSYIFTVDAMGANSDISISIGDEQGEKTTLSGWGTWDNASFDYSSNSDVEDIALTITADITASGGYGYINSVIVTKQEDTSSDVEYEWVDTDLLSNGDFNVENVTEGWTVNAEGWTIGTGSDTGAGFDTTPYLTIYTGNAASFSMSQRIDAEKVSSGTYRLKYTALHNDYSETITGAITAGNDTKSIESDQGRWGAPTSVYTDKIVITESQELEISLSGTYTGAFWAAVDDVVIQKYQPKEEDSTQEENTRIFTYNTTATAMDPVESTLAVDKVQNLPQDFITGFDVSSYLSIIKSGATYKDFDGNILTDAGFFKLLKDNGVNYIRLRVWVNPNDEDGNPYGGGQCDLNTAKVIGKYASDAGMKVLIDFHYSDFWTDPGKQTVPKAWKNLSLEDKTSTLKQYTIDSLKTLIDYGVNVGMVQVGNETTTGFCGESDIDNMCTLFKAGSEGVQAIEKAYNRQIMIAIHLTNPDSVNFSSYAASLKTNGVVYDVFATSFYPYWHGTLDNLKTKLSAVAKTYNKYVMVAETSYVNTLDDGDGHENTETQKKMDNGDVFPYEVSTQGQVTHVRNVVNTIAGIDNNKGIGVFYWEPAWIPVSNYNEASEEEKESVYNSNMEKWQTNGSGWATSYAATYDKNVQTWYGGSAVDNEGVFDFNGKALESLKVYNLIRGGSTTKNYVTKITDAGALVEVGDEIVLPETVSVEYANGDRDELTATWDNSQIEAAKAEGIGEYEISGTVVYNEEITVVKCILKITPSNYLKENNYGFESDAISPWSTVGEASKNVVDAETPRSGAKCYHFYNADDFTVGFEQTVKLNAGTYVFGGYIQGGDCGDDQNIYAYAKVGDNEYKDKVLVTGWKEWKNPQISNIVIENDDTEVTIGMSISAAGSGWGTCDDFYLYKLSENDLDEATDLINAIDTIGEVTLLSAESIAQIRAEYEALPDLAKTAVTNIYVLQAAELDLQILQIGEVTLEKKLTIIKIRQAYDTLSEDAKGKVDKKDLLEIAEEECFRLELIQEVCEKIDAIGEVTIESEAKIIEAREAYNELIEKYADADVINISTLIAAEIRLTQIKNAKAADEKAASEATAKAVAKAAAIKSVYDKINAIGEVTLESEAKIKEAREAYNELLKKYADATVINMEILTAAETKLEELKTEEEKKTSEDKSIKDEEEKTTSEIVDEKESKQIIDEESRKDETIKEADKDSEKETEEKSSEKVSEKETEEKTSEKNSEKENTEKENTEKLPVENQKAIPAAVGAEIVGKDTTDKGAYTVINTDSGLPEVEYSIAKDSTEKNIEIPDTVTDANGVTYKVTKIAENAFGDNKMVTSITIGENIIEIGANAFKNCTKLKKIIVKSSNIEKIDSGAFSGDKELTTVDLSKSKIKSIGKNAFSGCKKLKTIKLNGNKLTNVSKGAFKNIKRKATITISAKNKKTYKKIVKLIKNSGAKKVVYKYKKKK